MDRLIVFGGKGGVGKSSISTATAVYLAEKLEDKNVLLISFDIAHNLTDLFGQKIGNSLTQITDNLYAIEPDPDEYTKQYTGELEKKTHQLVNSSIILSSIPELKNFINTSFKGQNLPLALKNSLFFQSIVDAENPMKGIEEKKILVKMRDENGEDFNIPKFDYIVADFPPTGNMIALFEIPMDPSQQLLRYSLQLGSSMQEYINKLKSVGKLLNPAKWLFKKKMDISDQRDDTHKLDREGKKNLAQDILDILREIDERGSRIKEIFDNYGSLRLVSIAEKPSLEEAKSARKLSEPFISVDSLHLNRLIPLEEEGKSEYLDGLLKSQKKYTKLTEESFNDVKVWKSRLLNKEPIGMEGLLRLAKEIYGDASVEEIINPKD